MLTLSESLSVCLCVCVSLCLCVCHSVEWFIPAFARWFEAMGLQQQAGGVTLVGHSMGAMLATEWARLHPHTVRRLVRDLLLNQKSGSIRSAFNFWNFWFCRSSHLPQACQRSRPEGVAGVTTPIFRCDGGCCGGCGYTTSRRSQSSGYSVRWPGPQSEGSCSGVWGVCRRHHAHGLRWKSPFRPS